MSSHHAGTSHATSHPKSHNMNRPCLAHFKLLSSDCCSPTPRIFRVSTHKTNSMHSISSLPPSWPEPGHLSMEEDLHMAFAVLKASPPPIPPKATQALSLVLLSAASASARRAEVRTTGSQYRFLFLLHLLVTCWLFFGGVFQQSPKRFLRWIRIFW